MGADRFWEAEFERRRKETEKEIEYWNKRNAEEDERKRVTTRSNASYFCIAGLTPIKPSAITEM